MHQLHLFLAAVQFFTRLPVPGWVGHSPALLGSASSYLPLVGALIGLIAAVALWLAALVLPLPLAVGLSILAGLLATGAFHEDGLSDFADGMGGGHTKERALAIMKDPRIGAYGAIALILALLLRFEALLELGRIQGLACLVAVLVAAHAYSRLMAISVMLTQPYARNDDSARAKPAAAMSRSGFAFACLMTVPILALPVLSGTSLPSLATAMMVAFTVRLWLGRLILRRLGGYTGDCLGAVQQISELAFYLGLLATLR